MEPTPLDAPVDTPAPLGAPCPMAATAPMDAPSSPGGCSCGVSPGPGKPAEGNRPLLGRHWVDKALLCPSMPRFVPGSKMAGPGRPWGWRHWRAGWSLGYGRPGAGWATLWGPLLLPCPPKQPPLGLPEDGLGGNTIWAAVQMLPGLHGGQLHPPHWWDPAPGPAVVSHCEAGWQRAAQCPYLRDNRSGLPSATTVDGILGHLP